MKFIRFILRITKLDIVSVLKRKFEDISFMGPNELVALYYTISTFDTTKESADMGSIISMLKQAIIARMVETVRIEEERVKKNKAWDISEPKSTVMLGIDRRVNGSIESNIRILRTKFYEATRDGSFYEV